MKKGGITFESIGNNNGTSCGLNPLCHIQRFFGSIFSFLIIGCILCIVGYALVFQPSKKRGTWVGETTFEKKPREKCCKKKRM